MKSEVIAENIIKQAAPLFADDASLTEVYAGMCCQRLYVGPLPERKECSVCHKTASFYAIPRAAAVEDVVVIADLIIDPAPFEASLKNA